MNRHRNLLPYLTHMLALPIGFDVAAAGGGTATAAPPAPAGGGAPAAGGAGSGGAGGAGGAGGGNAAGAAAGGSAAGAEFSFFRNLPEREIAGGQQNGQGQDGAAGADGKRFVVRDDAGNPIAGAEFATEAEAQAYIDAQNGAAGGEKTPEQLAAEELAREAGTDGAANGDEGKGGLKVDQDTVLPNPIFGRFKTIREVEQYIFQSGSHSQKLADDLKLTRAELAKANETREAETQALRAELEVVRKTPQFQELAPEKLAELKKDDPAAYTEYVLAKRDHDSAVKAERDRAAQAVQDRIRAKADAHAETSRIVQEMDKDPKRFPLFRALDKDMGEIKAALGGENFPLHGNPLEVQVLYGMALARRSISLMGKADVKKQEAIEAAKKAAAGAAATTTGAGGGAGAPPKAKTASEQEHENWRKGIEGVAPGRVLNFSD